MRTSRARVLTASCLLAGGVLAGCTSVIDGQGQVAGTRFPSTGPATGSGSGSATGSGTSAPSSGRAPVPTRFRRTPVSTAVGDPPTADMCKAIGLTPFRALGLTPTLSDYQTPPGCTVRLTKGSMPIGSVSVFGATSEPAGRSGAKAETRHGLRVFAYAYQSSGNICERDIVAQGLNLPVYAIARTSTGASVGVTPYTCKSADAMTEAVTSAVAAHNVPRLPLADPSVSELDFCKVLAAADPDSQPAFAGTKSLPDGVSAGCSLTSSKIYTYLDFTVLGFGQAKNPKTLTIDGHQLEVGEHNTSTNCIYTAAQQSVGSGFAEAVTISTSVTGSDTAGACDQTAQLLATFLTTAGLP